MTETATVEGKTWMSQQEAARYANCHEATIWRARKSGELRAGGIGRKPRIHVSELDRWLSAGGPDRS